MAITSGCPTAQTLQRFLVGKASPEELAVMEAHLEVCRDCLIRQALLIMKTDFQSSTWQACWEHIVGGRPAAEVAAECGITVKAVYQAKARVLRRLRQLW